VTTPAKSNKPRRLTASELRAVSRALSDPTRFEILRHVAAARCAACADLRQVFPITPATLSHHLHELESCGLIATSRRGKFIDAVFQRTVWNAYVSALKEI
jgi:ArsR family transcriptional regulator, arsenate/arsenite/antimonite-responsive transcriptional repressor